MSTVSISILILFLLSTIGALPTPQIVYSAIIINEQNSDITCHVTWLAPSERLFKSKPFKINKDKYFVVNEQHIDMGTWTARAIIQRIDCGDLSLRAPFPNVSTVEKLWRFYIKPNEIISGERPS